MIGPTAFAPLIVTNMASSHADDSPATNFFTQDGRVVLVGAQSLLEASLDTNSNAVLTLYGLPGTTYDLLTTTNLIDGGSWRAFEEVTLSDLFQVISLGSATNQMRFFRAVEP
jgi:hypothetical protein